MKHIILTSLLALASFSTAFATGANPETPTASEGNQSFPSPTPSADQQIADLQKQLEIAKLKAAIAQASATPTPAPTPAPQVVIAPVFNVTGEKQNSDNVTQQQQVVAQNVAAPVVQATAPRRDLAPGELPSSNDYLNWTFRIWEALSRHDSNYVTSYTADGDVNYFGHRKTYDNYIVADMRNDAQRYVRYHNNYNLNSFLHDVSNEYSAHWVGPMIYDSITVFSEVWEANGIYHHATIRFTVGYTLPDNRVYALVMKVL